MEFYPDKVLFLTNSNNATTDSRNNYSINHKLTIPYMNSKSKTLKGYKGRDKISHRTYSRKTSLNRYKKTGKFTYRGTKVGNKVIFGLGHKAGENWGAAKEIDPNSQVRKYSKNSPSFDEGVYKYKQSAKSKALKDHE